MEWFSSSIASFYTEHDRPHLNLALCQKIGEARTPVYITLVTPLAEVVPSREQTLKTSGADMSEEALQADIDGTLFDLGSFELTLTVESHGYASGQLSLEAPSGARATLNFSNLPTIYLEVDGYSGPTTPDGNPNTALPAQIELSLG